MFLSLDLLFEYWSEHLTFELLYVMFRYSTMIFNRGVPDCPCGVWCRGLATCLLNFDPLFGNLVWNSEMVAGLKVWQLCHCCEISLYVCIYIYLYFSQYDTLFSFILYILLLLIFPKYPGTLLLHERRLHAFYYNKGLQCAVPSLYKTHRRYESPFRIHWWLVISKSLVMV